MHNNWSLPFPWVCTSSTFLVWLILWRTRTLSRLFSPALLPCICWPPCELDTEGWHSQRERPRRTRYHCLWRVGFLEVSQQSHIFIKIWFKHYMLRSWKGDTPKIYIFVNKKSWMGQSRNSRKYATKIWSYTVVVFSAPILLMTDQVISRIQHILSSLPGVRTNM